MNSAHPAIRIEAESTFAAINNAIFCIKGRKPRTATLGKAARAIDHGNWAEALELIRAAKAENKL